MPRLYFTMLFCLLFIVPGCKTISPELEDKPAAAIQEQRLYELKNLTGQECIANLTKLGFDNFPQINDPNSIIVSSTPELLNKANIIIELLDSEEEYIIANLGNASNVRNLPSNSQLALAMGEINIGTFSQPPQVSNKGKDTF